MITNLKAQNGNSVWIYPWEINMSNYVRIKTIIYGHNYHNEQFISEKRFNPDKISKTHNLSVE